ncbi:hypothetical protein PV318_03320 [Streptomyces sp. ME02-6991-2B]|nr:hypothetical protein [Streptomyces sp. ME02-6991-2B]
MAFPDDPTGVAVELLLDGEWVDVTGDVYTRDGITIEAGRHDEGARVDAGTCSLTMNNQSGDYSTRNPRSKWAGKLTRNTPFRVSVPAAEGALALDGTATAYASTPDASAIDITGDIDIRAEVTADWYEPTASQTLVGKWETTGNQRSWDLRIYQGTLVVDWTPDGTTLKGARSPALPYLPRRAAVRATIAFTGGDGGQALARFYTAPSIEGPWVQFSHDANLLFPTGSILAGTAPLRVGPQDATTTPPRKPLNGLVHRVEVRRGVDGPIVAAPDFTALEAGDEDFTDTAGRAWTLAGTAVIAAPRRNRFTGTVPAWPSRWETGWDVSVPIQAAGILRQLGQGASPLHSPMRRELSSPNRTGIVAYWPMEDGPTSTSLASALPSAPPLKVTSFGTPDSPGITPAAYSGWPASLALPTLGTGSATGSVPTYAPTGEAALRFFVSPRTDTPTTEAPMVALTCSGSAARWTLGLTPNTQGPGRQIRIRAFNNAGDTIEDQIMGGDPLTAGGRYQVGLDLTQTDADAVTWRLYYIPIPVGVSVEDSIPVLAVSDTVAGTIGRGTSVTIGGGTAADTVVGHVVLADSTGAYSQTSNAMIAWNGEQSSERIARLAREEDVPMTVIDYEYQQSTPLGPQGPETFLDLIQAAVAADGGLLFEDPDGGLAYRARTTLYNQPAALTLDYTRGEVAPPLEPTDDDTATANDVTATRIGGSSAREANDSEGPLAVNVIGRYASEINVNVFDDDQLPDIAGWMLHHGTWDEYRYPTIRVDLADDPQLIEQALRVGVGDRLTITSPPPWLPPEPIDQIVQGWTETIGDRTWAIAYNSTPAGPWAVGVVDDPVIGHADTDGSHLAAAVDEDATVIQVAVTDGPLWTTNPADMPFDVTAGGEVMTVTGITGATSPQTFTVTRGVNGLALPHPAGTDVRLARPSTVAL